jgi:hypothetical protein
MYNKSVLILKKYLGVCSQLNGTKDFAPFGKRQKDKKSCSCSNPKELAKN